MRSFIALIPSAAVLVSIVVGSAVPAMPGGPEMPPGEAVLSSEVGDALSSAIRSPGVKSALPPGWTILSVRVTARSIDVSISGPGGASAVVRLLPPHAGGGRMGHWFSFAFEGEDLPPDIRGFAKALDGTFTDNPWTPIPARGLNERAGDRHGERDDRGGRHTTATQYTLPSVATPPWPVLLSAFLQVLFVAWSAGRAWLDETRGRTRS